MPASQNPAVAEFASPDLAQRFRQVRSQTERLVQPLSAEDCQLQSMPDASPAKWHLAHMTWFFETFVLEKFEPGFKPFAQSHIRASYRNFFPPDARWQFSGLRLARDAR